MRRHSVRCACTGPSSRSFVFAFADLYLVNSRSASMLKAAVTKLTTRPQLLLNTSTRLRAANLRWSSPAAGCVKQFSTYKDVWGNDVDYPGFRAKRNAVMNSLLNSPKRFQSISEREDRSDIPIEAVKAHTLGKYFIEHRGCMLLKTADDLVIMQQVLSHIRPATVFEIGTFCGGTAIWMADMLRLIEVKSSVYAMDIDLSVLQDRVKEIKPENVTFLQGDSHKIEKTFRPDFLRSLPHPWLVVEDSHENTDGILEHFHQFMESGDYFIVEDTNPLIPKHLGAGRSNPEYTPGGDELLKILKRFLEKHDDCKVDTFFTDFFGYNGTWNWHGYIRKM